MDLAPALLTLLRRVERGEAVGFGDAAGLGELEVRGLVRREFGGRYIRALND